MSTAGPFCLASQGLGNKLQNKWRLMLTAFEWPPVSHSKAIAVLQVQTLPYFSPCPHVLSRLFALNIIRRGDCQGYVTTSIISFALDTVTLAYGVRFRELPPVGPAVPLSQICLVVVRSEGFATLIPLQPTPLGKVLLTVYVEPRVVCTF